MFGGYHFKLLVGRYGATKKNNTYTTNGYK